MFFAKSNTGNVGCIEWGIVEAFPRDHAIENRADRSLDHERASNPIYDGKGKSPEPETGSMGSTDHVFAPRLHRC